MNRYKDLALSIVRRWHSSGEYLVDSHVTLEMMGRGFLVTVVGSCGSGKSTLAWNIAKRLHEKGSRAPALIDEVAFHRFIDKPLRSSEYESRRPFARIREMAWRTRTPAIVTFTLNRHARLGRLLPPSEPERQLNRLALLTSPDLLHLSDLVWMTTRREEGYCADLMKSRTMNPTGAVSVRVLPNPEYRILDCPYFQRGVEMARQIEQSYG